MFRFGFRFSVADLFTGLLIVSILVAAAALATKTNVISGNQINIPPTPVVYPHSGQSYIPSLPASYFQWPVV